MVLYLFDLYLPRLRVPLYGFLATGSPRLTAIWFLCHRQSSLLDYPVLSHPRLAPILTLPTFAKYGVGLIC